MTTTTAQITPPQSASNKKTPSPCISENPTICGPRSQDQTVCSQTNRAAKSTLAPVIHTPTFLKALGMARDMTPNVVLYGGPQPYAKESASGSRTVRSSNGLDGSCLRFSPSSVSLLSLHPSLWRHFEHGNSSTKSLFHAVSGQTRPR